MIGYTPAIIVFVLNAVLKLLAVFRLYLVMCIPSLHVLGTKAISEADTPM
jgi:hypothetical protein